MVSTGLNGAAKNNVVLITGAGGAHLLPGLSPVSNLIFEHRLAWWCCEYTLPWTLAVIEALLEIQLAGELLKDPKTPDVSEFSYSMSQHNELTKI